MGAHSFEQLIMSGRTSTSVWILAGASVAASVGLYIHGRRRRTKEEPVESIAEKNLPAGGDHRILAAGSVTIAHGSVTGTCARMATELYQSLKEGDLSVQLTQINEFDWWDELLNDEDEPSTSKDSPVATLILLLPTYTDGTWTPTSQSLQTALDDIRSDWRISQNPLKNKLRVAIFGMGSSAYDNMGQPAREVVRAFQNLGAKCIVRLAVGDDAVGDANQTFRDWKKQVVDKLVPASGCACGSQSTSEGCCSSTQVEEKEAYESDDEEQEPEVMDVEDMGDVYDSKEEKSDEPREMVTPGQAKALQKEGYKLIGTHSAVKLCRWTKHQLRGRGGCYKHTFYGITSYQCMEATPSLACANKCVFCWRHHKNPVGKEWRWKTDEPDFIVAQAVEKHVNMIKEARGIPGVKLDRWQEAHTVRHCALSLVGEPIMYPRIVDLLQELHNRKISTFLVTNGQHPEAINSLNPITQLYVSVDAPTKESLIEIDRPLFQDAWERLKLSLTYLKGKGQRTVARLTVVKGWNSDEVEGYAQLIALGHVSLVEIKGVTFCGKSDASNLNMTNTPWHHEVVDLARTLKVELDKVRSQEGADNCIPEYDLACEHKHSCSVLLARVDQFSVVDAETNKRKWKTWIDYDKFQELAARNKENPSFTFSVEDYTADTPDWAVFGAEEEGFDPTDTRHRKKTKHPMYTKFDQEGIPTHDHENAPLSEEQRSVLVAQMERRIQDVGATPSMATFGDGSKEIQDARLMFRGMVITK